MINTTSEKMRKREKDSKCGTTPIQLLYTTGAAERWQEDGDFNYRDDISVFVIYLAEPNGAGSATTTVMRQEK